MSEPKPDDLLQSALDGALGEAEAAQLRSRLAGDPALRARAAELQRLAQLLDGQARAEPPPALVDQVMKSVAAASEPAAERRRGYAIHQLFTALVRHFGQAAERPESSMAGWAGGGAIVAKKALWAVAGLALIVVLAVVYYNGTRSVNSGAEGTIGAADRYRGAQPTSKDVVAPQAAAQQFLQSDLFDRIAKDRNLRSLIVSQDAQLLAQLNAEKLKGLTAQDCAELQQFANLQVALGGAEAAEGLKNLSARLAVADLAKSGALNRGAMRAFIGDPQALELLVKARASFQGGDDQFVGALRAFQRELAVASQGGQLAELNGNVKFRAAMQQDAEAMLKLAGSRAFMEGLQNQAFLRALNNQAFLRALGSSESAELFANLRLMEALNDASVMALASKANILMALQSSEALREALTVRGFQEALQTQSALQSRLAALDQEGLNKQ